MTYDLADPTDFLLQRFPIYRGWRRHLHSHPETAFNEHETSSFVAGRLREMGLAVETGLAGTGVVATLKGSRPGPSIGLRADMDALPIAETSAAPWRSLNPGASHACGHDGHMTMLLAAADYLSRERDISGTVHFVFQPAEEAAGGGQRMVEEGLFETFPMERIFGLHNWPGLPLGQVAIRPGAMMAAMDLFSFRLRARGVHAAMPHLGTDAIVAAGALAGSLQNIVSRAIDPHHPLVLSLTQIHGGQSLNALPDQVDLQGTLRYFDEAAGAVAHRRMREIAEGVARSHDVAIDLEIRPAYPVTSNETDATMASAARRLPEGREVVEEFTPSTASEDFAFMLTARPGAYAWIGNGRDTALHNPDFDFNDDLIPIGARYWIEVVGEALGTAGTRQSVRIGRRQDMRLSGKRALLVGAATGIGRATAIEFARNGARQVIADINREAAEDCAALCREAGGDAVAVACDVRDEISVKTVVDDAEATLGGLDTLVYLAGLQRTGEIASFDAGTWNAIFDVNARGTFFAAKYAGPAIQRAGGGSIITTSSLAGLRGAAGMASYAAAKGAVIAFTVALAQELAPHNIRVNSVLPGWIDTPFNNPAIELMGGVEAHAEIVRRIVPLGRQGTPEDVAPIYVFLASEESRYITAKSMMVDGGMAH